MMFIYDAKKSSEWIKLIAMKELKPIDYKILFELMKDSHRSDRQLAKSLRRFPTNRDPKESHA